MINARFVKLGLPLAAAALVIGCGGGGGNNGGSAGGATGGSSGGSGADAVDLAIAKNGSNARYASLKGKDGSAQIVNLSDSNPTGAGVLTLIANLPDGASGRTQGLQLQYAHGAALAVGSTFSPTDPGALVLSEITVPLSDPTNASTKSWYATSGTVEVTAVDATRVTLRFAGVGLVPNGSGDETGTPVLSGTASGTLAAD